MHNFKEMLIWQKAMELAEETYLFTKEFPDEERFNLTSQMRRSIVSVPSNIAEGTSRSSNKAFNHFLEIALGSSFEFETQMILSNRLKYMKDQDFNQLEIKTNELQKMIYGFKKRIQS